MAAHDGLSTRVWSLALRKGVPDLNNLAKPCTGCVAAHGGLSTRVWSLALRKGARDLDNLTKSCTGCVAAHDGLSTRLWSLALRKGARDLDNLSDPAQVCVAAHDGLSTRVWSLALHKGARDRVGEDAVASRLALHALAGACGRALYPGAPGLPPRDTLELLSDETPQVTPHGACAGAMQLAGSP